MMEKKVAIAVDTSVHAMEAVRYAARMAAVIPELRLVLLNIQPAVSQYLTDEAKLKQSAQTALKKVMTANEARALEILESAAQCLLTRGVDQSRIERLTIPRNTAVADDILALSQLKSYDAVLLGRRGSSYMQEWVMGSVSATLVEHSRLTPIWVVDGEVPSEKVVLAADGSQSALRALDHMAFILSGQTDRPVQKIHVLHIQPRFQDYCQITVEKNTATAAEAVLLNDDRHCMDDFHRQALAVLEQNGLPARSLELHTLQCGLSIARTIIQFAQKNDFGTIVMGRSGRSKSLFTGSVSRSLLHKTSQSALWVVP